jgi:hypothetical protein
MTTDKSRADALTDLQIMEALEATGVKWQEQRSLANDREILTFGSTPAADIIAGIRAILAASPALQPAAAPIDEGRRILWGKSDYERLLDAMLRAQVRGWSGEHMVRSQRMLGCYPHPTSDQSAPAPADERDKG